MNGNADACRQYRLLLGRLLYLLWISVFVLCSYSAGAVVASIPQQEYDAFQAVWRSLNDRAEQIKALIKQQTKVRANGRGYLEAVAGGLLTAEERTLLEHENADRRKYFEFLVKFSEPAVTNDQVVAAAIRLWNESVVPVADKPLFTDKPLLRLHGSNTIGAKLAPELAKAFLKRKGYHSIEEVPVRSDEVLVVGSNSDTGVKGVIEIKAHGSHTGFEEDGKFERVGLKGGYCDIGMSSAPVTTLTRKDSSGKETSVVDDLRPILGDLTSRTSENVIALDAVAVIVNPSNPLNSLNVQDLARIFTGKVTYWNQVPSGRFDSPIQLFSRDERSGTYDTFRNTVLGGKRIDFTLPQIMKAPDGSRGFENSNELSGGVASDLYGIGFVGFPYIGQSKALAMRSGSAREFSPNRITIRSGEYPLSRKLYFYVPENNVTPIAREFLAFTFSAEGQRVVERTEFVPLTPLEDENAELCREKKVRYADARIPIAYKKLIRDFERHEIVLHFDKNRDDLDNLGFKDIDRLVADPRIENVDIRLIGFADPSGPDDQNLRLSRGRADFVKQALVNKGLRSTHVYTEGFGEEPSLLLDTNEDDKSAISAERNRRVEVWLRSGGCAVN